MTWRAILCFVGLVLAGLILLAAVAIWFLPRATPSRQGLRLSAVSFDTLPGWTDGRAEAALGALRLSCTALAGKPAAQSMGGAGYAGTVGDWRAACKGLPAASNARHFFETAFKPFAISANGRTAGLFTGYYEPQLRASRTQHGPYQTPVYGVPADLISVDLGLFGKRLKGETIAGRLEGQRLVPYATRADIDAHGLPLAPVLFYAADPIAVFFLQIQGSGRILFDDGAAARAAYAGKNGRPYTAIGRTLISRGALRQDNVSMQTIRAWLKNHPTQARHVMETNESYTFFSLLPLADPTSGSRGSEGVPLTAGASMAVDNRIHPLGVVFFLSTTLPGGEPFHRIMIAQDTGGAIRGAIRGDVYWGTGERAERLAGTMKSQGKIFALLPNTVAAGIGSAKTFELRQP